LADDRFSVLISKIINWQRLQKVPSNKFTFVAAWVLDFPNTPSSPHILRSFATLVTIPQRKPSSIYASEPPSSQDGRISVRFYPIPAWPRDLRSTRPRTRTDTASARRQELVQWLNSLLQLNITKVEQCGTG
jgi:hypothetical protein